MGNTMKKAILVVDDSRPVQRLIETSLETDYDVATASNGAEALEVIKVFKPDLIILDVMMPVMDGYEVVRRLKSNYLTWHIPILMLSAKGRADDKVRGLDLGADDYMAKPFNTSELRARVEAILRMKQSYLDANPSTRLPGNVSIERQMLDLITSGKLYAVVYTDLDNFKAYNDHYGFLSGDQIIIQTAELIKRTVVEKGNEDDFVGHIGGDDFIFTTTPDKVRDICETIILRFDELAKTFYAPEDLQRGGILAENRQGLMVEYPIMTISMMVVTNERRTIEHPAQIAAIATELKTYVKKLDGSNYVIDKRTDEVPQEYQSNIKILVVENDVKLSNFLSELLRKEGYHVFTARNGAEALAMVSNRKPNMVLLDVNLPLIDGYNVCNLLKNNPEFKSIPIMMLSGNVTLEDVKAGLQNQAEDYITTPIHPETLIGAIRRYTQNVANISPLGENG
ncbi:MAG: response regulator [Gemmatimonadetes bacterium]|nr:MAG: response regulator [Gemmatimonadota bacterium]